MGCDFIDKEIGCVPSAISSPFMLEHHGCIFLEGETVFSNKPYCKDGHDLNDDDITCNIGIRQTRDQNVRSDTDGYGKGEADKLPY